MRKQNMDSLIRCYLMSLCFSIIMQAGFAKTGTVNPIFPTKTYVEINNHMSADLAIHCKSRDDDLGNHVLAPQGRWGFRFRPNFFIEDTLFFCTFTWAGQVRDFDIYEERRDEYRCKNCIWKVKPDGPCLRQKSHDICYPWKWHV